MLKKFEKIWPLRMNIISIIKRLWAFSPNRTQGLITWFHPVQSNGQAALHLPLGITWFYPGQSNRRISFARSWWARGGQKQITAQRRNARVIFISTLPGESYILTEMSDEKPKVNECLRLRVKQYDWECFTMWRFRRAGFCTSVWPGETKQILRICRMWPCALNSAIHPADGNALHLHFLPI